MHVILHLLWVAWQHTASSVVGNGPDDLVAGGVIAVLWNRILGPRVRKWHEAETKRHLHSVLDEREKRKKW